MLSLEIFVLCLLFGVLLKFKDVLKVSIRFVVLEKEVMVFKMDDFFIFIIFVY